MNDHTKHTLADIEARMADCTEQLRRLDAARHALLVIFGGDQTPPNPAHAPDTTAQVAPEKGSGVRRKPGRPKGSRSRVPYIGAGQAKVYASVAALPDQFSMADFSRLHLSLSSSLIANNLARLIRNGSLTKLSRGQYRKVSPQGDTPPAATPSGYVPPRASRDNELPPAPGSVSDILARHNVLIEDMEPIHAGAVEIGRTFQGDFTLTDAQARIGRKQAGYWLARWKENGWIETVGLSTYRRTGKFGQKP